MKILCERLGALNLKANTIEVMLVEKRTGEILSIKEVPADKKLKTEIDHGFDVVDPELNASIKLNESVKAPFKKITEQDLADFRKKYGAKVDFNF